MPGSGELAKLTIENLDNQDQFSVLFNPTEFSVEDLSKWKDQERTGQIPELQYTGGQRQVLTMELFFDSYEKNEDVRKYTGKIAKLIYPTINEGNDGKRPPKIKLSWGVSDPDGATGIFPFVGVLEKLTQQFTLFKSDGTPVRAKLRATFKGFYSSEEELRRRPRRNSYPVQTYTVKAGDSLSSISTRLWKDPEKWRIIARENEISNPRLLDSGMTLVIPAIE